MRKIYFKIMLFTLLGSIVLGYFPQPKAEENYPASQVYSDAAVLAWANEAAVAMHSYNFATYTKTLRMVSNYFTPDGWLAYKEAFYKSGNLETVVKEKLIVSSVAEGAPLILNKETIANQHVWLVQVPLLITSESPNNSRAQHTIVTMRIVSTPKNVGVRGLGIEQITVLPKKASD